jgi:amidase
MMHRTVLAKRLFQAAETNNNLFGRTLNPHRLSQTAGGSSGGEGVCVAMRGSIIGIGTDIAGSIRIPSLCNGTYGFKPSTNRIPYGGQTSSGRKGGPGVKASAGPLANSVEDLHLLFKAVIFAAPWQYDSQALAMPYKEIAKKTTLRLGFLTQDPAHPVSPPVARALQTASKKLADAGHEIITMNGMISPAEAADLCWKFYLTDPQDTSSSIIKEGGEPKVPAIISTWENPRLPNVDMDEYYNINTRRRYIKAQWHKVFVEQKLDAIMLPGSVSTAPAHDKYGTVCYTAFANLLDVRLLFSSSRSVLTTILVSCSFDSFRIC